MHGRIAIVPIVLLLLAGCSDPSAPAAGDADPRPDGATLGAMAVHYRCPGGGDSTAPCGTPADGIGLFGVEDLVALPGGVAFAVGTSAADRTGTAPGRPDPGAAFAKTSDQGATWSVSFLPTVATTATRTGQASAESMSLAVAEDGSLMVTALLSMDPERGKLGGEFAPPAIQARREVAALVSRDEGANWQASLLSGPGDHGSGRAWPWPGGGAVAGWSDGVAGEAVLRASRDLGAWGPEMRVPDCEVADLAWLDGRAFLACVAPREAPELGGAVRVVELDLVSGYVDLALPPSDGWPACVGVDLVPRPTPSIGMALVASGCPDIGIFVSLDGSAWTRQASTAAEDLGVSTAFYSELTDVAFDGAGRMHGAFTAYPAAVLCCGEKTVAHLVIDPWTGAVLHEERLSTITADGPGAVGLAGEAAMVTPGSVEWMEGTGWLAWPGERPRVGLFTLG